MVTEYKDRYSSLSTGSSENKFIEAASQYFDFAGRVHEESKITGVKRKIKLKKMTCNGDESYSYHTAIVIVYKHFNNCFIIYKCRPS